ncbi:hypothetical protein KDH_64550 [Dictyobacter sp. S3.2.2.5]|uniref:Uncharacterized protein n=1 Tax=Dictyobacter halimunensis TaxID=3026934 RepID=A0ABQ6FZD4_9CHLR|nr:hypothetical protein KDH_64550 [Dictyobacter sp. S3.2.2.5]
MTHYPLSKGLAALRIPAYLRDGEGPGDPCQKGWGQVAPCQKGWGQVAPCIPACCWKGKKLDDLSPLVKGRPALCILAGLL